MRGNAQNLMLIVSTLLAWTILSISGASKNSDLKLVCYYSNWAVYRPGLAKFTPENINPYLCTHLIYAFAGMNKNYELKPFDSWNDIQQGNYKKFVNLKTYNPKLKLLIAVGGWNEGSKRFSKMVESSQTRLKFVSGAISFLRKHGFDGLDLDWEYPGFRDGGQDEDKEGYAKLVTELRDAFDSESIPRGKAKLLLTMAVPAGQQYIDKGFDVPVLSRNLDFFNLLTYDYHTSTEPLIDHHAPLGERPGLEDWDPNRQFNIKWTIQYYVKLGADRKKLILGVPTYGRSFTLQDPDEYEIGSPADGPGEKGSATREKGYLSYYEICQKIQDEDWELEAPYPSIMGPYAFRDNEWVGFDDEDIIVEKARYILSEGLGGGMVWTLDNDDFRGSCYGEQSPLINTLKSILFGEFSEQTHKTPLPSPPPKTTTQRMPRRQQRRKSTSVKQDALTTPAPFTTPDPGAPFECEEEGFFNNPTDCKKYFWCLDSGPSNLGLVPHAFTCPSGLFFNKKRDACDYAGNVVCRVKTTAATTTTRRPRVRPRKKTTSTTTTTTTTTPKPSRKIKIPKDIQNDLAALNGPLNAIKLNSQSLTELLQLIQNLGVNKIHDQLQDNNPEESETTLSPTLPEYRSPNRRRPTTTIAPTADPFAEYAKPDRSGKNNERPRVTVKPRGPQYEITDTELQDETDDSEAINPDDRDVEFPFVYHTPKRHRTTTDTENSKDAEAIEEYDDDDDDYTTSKPTTQPRTQNNKRVVVKVRPIPGEGRKRNPPGTLFINSGTDNASENQGNSNYVLAQTIGVRRVAHPTNNNNNNKESPKEQSPTQKPLRRNRTNQLSQENKFSNTGITQLVTKTYQTTPRWSPSLYQMTVPTGRPAVPATIRTQRPRYQEAREPALALLPDGRITCLKRGVYPHPMDCAKFLVCVPAEGNIDEFDGFIHDCPKGTYFKEGGGRCMLGNREVCNKQKR